MIFIIQSLCKLTNKIVFRNQLKTREDLKQKFNATERECRCLQEKNRQLEKENDAFKSKVEVVLKDNEHYVSQKVEYI